MSSEPRKKLYRRQALLGISVATGLLALIALFNFLVDPPQRFARLSYSPELVKRYVDLLQKSEFGLNHWITSRDLKYELSSRRADCYVFGSSRGHLLSPRLLEGLKPICPSVINLTVEAFEFNDLLLLARRAVKAGARKVILVLDGHFFAFDTSRLWRFTRALSEERYHEELSEAVRFFETDFDLNEARFGSSNYELLLDWRLFRASLRRVWSDGVVGAYQRTRDSILYPTDPKPVPPFELRNGRDRETILPDGAVIPSLQKVAEQRASRNQEDLLQLGSIGWITTQEQLVKKRAEAMKKVALRLKKEGIEIVAILPPYEATKIQRIASSLVPYLEKGDGMTLKIAREVGFAVYGSYDSRVAGCDFEEFTNLAHAKLSCLEKTLKICLTCPSGKDDQRVGAESASINAK